MNTIRIKGKVIKKTKEKKNDLVLNVVLAIPLNFRIFNEGVSEQEYNYVSFNLICLNKDFSNLRKGSFVEIVGEIIGNCNKDVSKKTDLFGISEGIGNINKRSDEIMSWQTRDPSVKISLDKELFNILVGILDINSQIKLDDESFSNTANKLKDKLLTYSVPRINDNGEEYIDIRFFPNEASDMIWQLMIRNEPSNNDEDYYSILINNREQRKKQ